jgi:hypothetical protein
MEVKNDLEKVSLLRKIRRQLMSLRITVSEAKTIFSDPISQTLMKNPVTNTCGHIFDETQINGWMKWTPTQEFGRDKPPHCPLCEKPIEKLYRKILTEMALIVLNSLRNRVKKELTNDEVEIIEAAIADIMERRNEDKIKGIPSRLPHPMTFPG